MMTYPDIDPVAFSIGSFSVHWYGIMYLFAFASAWLLGMYRAGRPDALITRAHMENLITWAAFGVTFLLYQCRKSDCSQSGLV